MTENSAILCQDSKIKQERHLKRAARRIEKLCSKILPDFVDKNYQISTWEIHLGAHAF